MQDLSTKTNAHMQSTSSRGLVELMRLIDDAYGNSVLCQRECCYQARRPRSDLRIDGQLYVEEHARNERTTRMGSVDAIATVEMMSD